MIDPRLIIQGLVARGVPEAAAYGLAGNMAVESGYDPGINEIAPLVPGSRGGFGLIQWTGPRRKQLEAYAGDNVADLDTQLDFLVHELNSTEAKARDAIYQASDPVQAAELVSDLFLRPGIPHKERRIAETQALLNAGYAPQAAPQTPSGGSYAPSAPRNALNPLQDRMATLNALRSMMPQPVMLDPAMFQSRNALSRI